MKPVLAENGTRRRFEVRHVTRYTYSESVTASYGRACLRPRSTDSQTVLASGIQIDPVPDLIDEHLDFFGNHRHYFEVHTPHTALTVTKTSLVDVRRPPVEVAALDRWDVATAADSAVRHDPTLTTAYLLPSPTVELGAEVRAYAERLLPRSAPLGRALAQLVSGIHRDFSYTPGATDVQTSLHELLELRSGVCQDFAHLAVGCLRAVGVPARYVSGYLETQPPPGQPRLQGADATHAWVSVLLPDGRWIDLDPTNDCLADSRYVVMAWGRDYRDVVPLKGVILTEGMTTSLDVGVDVIRVPDGSNG